MTKIKVFIGSLISAITLLPALAFAQSGPTPNGQPLGYSSGGNLPLSDLGNFLNSFSGLMNKVVPILIGLAVIAFLFGVLKFVFNAGDPEARKTGQSFMIWAVIGIVVMVSVWGLVFFVQNTFGVQNGPVQNGPGLPQSR